MTRSCESSLLRRNHGSSVASIRVLQHNSRESGKSLSDHFVREFLKIQVYDEAKCLWTYQIHRIHPNMPAAAMMGIGLMWDFQKRIVHAAVIT